MRQNSSMMVVDGYAIEVQSVFPEAATAKKLIDQFDAASGGESATTR